MNTIGKGAYSNGSNPITPDVQILVPGAPVIGAVSGGNGEATVHWTAPASDGGAPLIGYEVQPVDAVTGAAVGDARSAASNATLLTVYGLTNGRAYRFTVRAVNEVGTGDASAASAPVTPKAPAPPATVPSSIATITATSGASGGAKTVTIRWTPPSITGGSPIVSYRVVRQQLNSRGHGVSGTTTTATVSASGRSTTYTAPKTAPAGTRYSFTIYPVNAKGAGAGKAVTGTVR
jgi:hypothetical protein